jgi:hypothetical protein
MTMVFGIDLNFGKGQARNIIAGALLQLTLSLQRVVGRPLNSNLVLSFSELYVNLMQASQHYTTSSTNEF